MIVHKFGGTSISSVENIINATGLIEGKNECIIVSALGCTTNKLVSMLEKAANQESYEHLYSDLISYHYDIIDGLIKNKSSELLKEDINSDFMIMRSILNTVSLMKNYSNSIYELVIGFGEILSAQIISLYLSSKSINSKYVNAASFLWIKKKHSFINIDWDKSRELLYSILEGNFDCYVITGFIATNSEGVRTTLGFNGSDFSSTIVANLIQAKKVIIWTDVSGVYSADPRKVKSSIPIETLSYKEALELSYFGASVLHPKTITPVMKAKIPIYIKNSLSKNDLGTVIEDSISKDQTIIGIKALTSIENVALVNIQGTGLIGVSDISVRIFELLKRANIDIIMISQASSEYSLCFVIYSKDIPVVSRLLNDEFLYDLKNNNIDSVKIDDECSIITAVGDGMIGSKQAAGRLFNALSYARINIKAIAQGSSERSISTVINRSFLDLGINVIHDEFYSNVKRLSLGIIGMGKIGSALIKQIHECKESLEKRNIALNINGIMNSTKMFISNNPINLDDKIVLKEICNIDIFISHIKFNSCGIPVILDLTASKKIAAYYLKILSQDINIIAANKYTNSGCVKFYKEIHNKVFERNLKYLYETNVCAGLPILKTIRSLLATGDTIISIEGVFSGTLSFIFNRISEGDSFAAAVNSAYKLGYTEPDPREDLSGMDVARKVIILAREIGLEVSLGDFEIQDLTPKELTTCSIVKFLSQLGNYNSQIPNSKQDCVYRYIGSISKEHKVKVGIRAIDSNSPLYNLNGSDNIVIIKTRRYNDIPLVIKGPGAGPEVTAAGVFDDILDILN